MSKIEAEGLRKQYKGREVVKNVSLEIRDGEIVGLLGPNGAGKTTCFYMIVGLIPGDGGDIRLDGADIGRLPMHQRARLGIGYLPQEPSVFRQLSVADNIGAILETRPELAPADRDRLLEELLRDLNIAERRDTLGISLSGGERRRVEIARALATAPRFMLLDEPFAGVDPISVLEIQQLIKHLQKRGIGVLITDHNVRETLKICDRAYILNEGRVLAAGAPAEILNNADVKRVYLGADFRL
ncbi:MAG: LPS export ABC transporter ATP-binding protein [Candidatus Muproteobacteria bacterium RIFCSPHIGHO2_01_FULL_65_16]|uniref:Lipopolysaccharide export system ATP-binding protein LptB n=3 Tax=Candidatus Muproteobacteria TaxID=1817795 RepID=A0A1F6TA77_9PROT|nr:MAG: LPS export ABC transporter ATP-binding protein [Candidatus Muproteobacteria bacterium RBG_16_65_31]OGI45105.1 MAG: LPS export ABC transporter ATP-binding protein [Candidatus Muproteobacteria bacterium RIFCSPHIGHO2_01_FULL_65_16]OGI50421.1 MAG: LPS export ABC transporter ATP-binding protein [Candidatus Muproteobacteria bacterium RIFCSPHIGHO2_02_FULL_65_16]